MMELQLMSRNEFLLCLIKTKQNRIFSVTGSTYIWSTMLTVWTVPSLSRLVAAERAWATHGPWNAFRIINLILRIRKWNWLPKSQEGMPVNKRYQKTESPYKHVHFCALGNGAQLECGKERKCFLILLCVCDKKANDLHIWGKNQSFSFLGLMECYRRYWYLYSSYPKVAGLAVTP